MFTRPVVCVAGGPSLTLRQVRHLGIAKQRGLCDVIAVNDAVYPCWFADVCYASDIKWWAHHNSLPDFPGSKVTIHQEVNQPDIAADVKRLKADYQCEGYTSKVGFVTTGGNSGHAAVHYAADRGATKIILVAYDFTGLPEGHRAEGSVVEHWFGKHEPPLYREGNNQEGDRLKKFLILTNDLRNMNIKIINCSGASKIDWLPKGTLESVLPLEQ